MKIRNLLAFGTGIGIQIGENDLEVVAARVRPSGIGVRGRTILAGFRTRPAAEWGAEYSAFLKEAGAAHLSAIVLLPRGETIVRQIALPGVADKDLAAAISFQLDNLHPYGEDDVVSGWRQLDKGQVLIGIIRRDALERYVSLFAEAGIAVAAFTFSASMVHSALRFTGPAPAEGFAAVCRTQAGAVEIYGENPGRPVFSAEFELSVERAATLAVSELRLAPDTALRRLDRMLPEPRVNPVENDLSHNALAYATAMGAACPWLAPVANLLPAGQRASSARAMFVPTAVLAALVLVVAMVALAFPGLQDHHYLGGLQAEIRRLEPTAQQAATLDRQIETTRTRARLLDEFRGRTRADLAALNELSRLLAPPAWTSGLDLSRTSVVLQGEAEQAAALIKAIDDSPFFQNSELSPIGKMANLEIFRIRAEREAHK